MVNTKIIHLIKNPIRYWNIFKIDFFVKRNISMPDDLYLKKLYKLNFHKELDLDNPLTYNEKLQWLKLYDRNPLFTSLADKILVRDYVKDKIGEQYLIPMIGCFDSPNDIDFDALPNQFVLKCNHNSGLGMYICKDKSKLTNKDINKIKHNLQIGLNENYYIRNREWCYKNIKPRIICEHYLKSPKEGINDFKFYCFNGVVKFFLVSSERNIKVRFNYFDINCNPLPFSQGGGLGNYKITDDIKDDIYAMIKIATILSQNIQHVRVDLYCTNHQIYFGEMTFFDSAGFAPFHPGEWDKIIGGYFAPLMEYKER